jgi:hypothetical protein
MHGAAVARSFAHEPDHRHYWLLRTRRERPCHRGAKQRYELSPLQPIEMHPLPLASMTA